MERSTKAFGGLVSRSGQNLILADRQSRFAALAGPRLDHSFRLATLILKNSNDAEDAVQDATLSAWKSFDELRNVGAFDAWFDRILINGCRDRLRRQRLVHLVASPKFEDFVSPDHAGVYGDGANVLALLDSLTHDERLVVVLRFWDDLAIDDISHRTGWPVGTVKTRLRRALNRLRDHFPSEDSLT